MGIMSQQVAAAGAKNRTGSAAHKMPTVEVSRHENGLSAKYKGGKRDGKSLIHPNLADYHKHMADHLGFTTPMAPAGMPSAPGSGAMPPGLGPVPQIAPPNPGP